MILYMLVAAITIGVACLVRKTAYIGHADRQRVLNTLCIAAIFTILTLLAALRIEVGNDYGTYVVTCHEIFQGGYVVTEPGYNLVVRILYTLSGSENYLLMFGVFGAAIVLIFLKCMYDGSDCFALSFLLFMLLGIYFRSFNTVRYYFALALALYAARFLVDIKEDTIQKIIKFVLVIAIAATFHKSVLVVIPLYLIARIPWNKWMYIAVALGGAGIYVFRDKVMEIALLLYPSYKDTIYVDQIHSFTENAPMIARIIMVIVLCTCCYKSAIVSRADNRMYLNMSIMALVLYVSCYWMPLVTRFGYYLITPQILLVPNVIFSINSADKRRKLIALTVLVALVIFAYFLKTASAEGIRVLPYKSWLFYDHRWLNQTDTF